MFVIPFSGIGSGGHCSGCKNNLLNVNKSIKENFNLLRVGNNELFPSYFYYKSIKYIIKIFKKE